MLSIIQQLIDDKSEIVREALARNLGLLVSYVEDHEKVSQVSVWRFVGIDQHLSSYFLATLVFGNTHATGSGRQQLGHFCMPKCVVALFYELGELWRQLFGQSDSADHAGSSEKDEGLFACLLLSPLLWASRLLCRPKTLAPS